MNTLKLVSRFQLHPYEIFLIIGLGIFFLAQQLYILGAWTPVPFVDSWPVLHRFMEYQQGKIDTLHYLMNPHGAHLHLIVYFIYALDAQFFGAQQFLPMFAGLTATLIVDGIFLFVYFTAIKNLSIPRPLVLIGAALALYFINVPSGTNLHIFQVVLTASRAAFCAIWLGMIWALQKDDRRWHIILLALACVAVTFHGSGVLFALAVAMLYALFGRTLLQRCYGLVPVITVLAFSAAFIPPGTGEFHAIGKVLLSLDPLTFWNILLGVIGYYGSMFAYMWGGLPLSYPVIMSISLIVVSVTTLNSFHLVCRLLLEKKKYIKN